MTNTVDVSGIDNLEIAPSEGTIVVTTDSDVEILQVLSPGPPGPPGPEGPPSTVVGPVGPPGPQGPRGNTVGYGPADPINTYGANGDFFINTTTNFIFGPKLGNIWPAGTSIVGPQGQKGDKGDKGDQGIKGDVGVQGPIGLTGADGNTVLYGVADPTAAIGVNGNFYINTTTHFMFGPKALSVWDAGTSLIGPQGLSGTSQMIIADTPPAGASDGTVWYESDSGLTFLRLNDGTSTQWVQIKV
jgi:hypothetical protein